MEKAESLVALDRQICNYHLRNNYSKKDNIYCYQPDRKQIAQFYSSMADHFYQAKLQSSPQSPRARPLKARSHTQHALKDPTLACLPPTIPQDNLIDPGAPATTMNPVPMFSEVQASKKQKYLIAKEIREMVGHDIHQMQKEKDEVAFRRRFPSRQPRAQLQPQETKTEFLIKEFNRLLIKYKNNGLNLETSLTLLEKENHPNFPVDSSADQQFRILNLFKKLYLQTKSTDINQQLINYLLKFHLSDKLSRKLKARPVHTPAPTRHPIPPPQLPKPSRTNSQASACLSTIKEYNNESSKNRYLKIGKTQQDKQHSMAGKGSQKMRSNTTHQMKLKI